MVEMSFKIDSSLQSQSRLLSKKYLWTHWKLVLMIKEGSPFRAIQHFFFLFLWNDSLGYYIDMVCIFKDTARIWGRVFCGRGWLPTHSGAARNCGRKRDGELHNNPLPLEHALLPPLSFLLVTLAWPSTRGGRREPQHGNLKLSRRLQTWQPPLFRAWQRRVAERHVLGKATCNWLWQILGGRVGRKGQGSLAKQRFHKACRLVATGCPRPSQEGEAAAWQWREGQIQWEPHPKPPQLCPCVF